MTARNSAVPTFEDVLAYLDSTPHVMDDNRPIEATFYIGSLAILIRACKRESGAPSRVLLDLAVAAFSRLNECGAIPDDNQGDAAFVDDFECLVDRIEKSGESEFTRLAVRSLRENITAARELGDDSEN